MLIYHRKTIVPARPQHVHTRVHGASRLQRHAWGSHDLPSREALQGEWRVLRMGVGDGVGDTVRAYKGQRRERSCRRAVAAASCLVAALLTGSTKGKHLRAM